MSNYIPHYTKKRQILRKKSDHLRRLISRGAENETLLKAAEEVRLARIRALNAERANPPGFRGPKSLERARQWGAEIKARLSAAEEITAEAILAEFERTASDSGDTPT